MHRAIGIGLVILAVGCATERGRSSSTCDAPGAVVQCSCAFGALGSKMCGQDGVWEPCGCPDAPGDATISFIGDTDQRGTPRTPDGGAVGTPSSEADPADADPASSEPDPTSSDAEPASSQADAAAPSDETAPPDDEVCTPSCAGKQCGDDGCGDPAGCGMCPGDGTCVNNQCESDVPPCQPSCSGKQCGDDGCGDPWGCSQCPAGQTCEAYQCVGGPGPNPGSDACGICAPGTTCGASPVNPTWCAGPNCQGVTFVGHCMGDIVVFCDQGTLFSIDCLFLSGGQAICGLNPEAGFYDCVAP